MRSCIQSCRSRAALIALCCALPSAALAIEAGQRAPDFRLPDLKGEGQVSLSDHKGKVIYLDFWASWCGPCVAAIPQINGLTKDFPQDRFQVIAVNVDSRPDRALKFLRKTPVTYPSASDPKGRLPGAFGLESMPSSYLIDQDGVVRYVHKGFRKGDIDQIRSEVSKLMAKRTKGEQ